MVKLQVFGNISKTVSNIKNLTWVKMISTSRSTYPAILIDEKGAITPRWVIKFTSKLQGR
jgi:hypothetical protein